jgi:putative endonuclease
MWYVYVLQSKRDSKLYTGCTNDLRKRVELHNTGKLPATRSRHPLAVIYSEAYLNKFDAFEREKWLKSGRGRNHLKRVLKHHFDEKNN